MSRRGGLLVGRKAVDVGMADAGQDGVIKLSAGKKRHVLLKVV